MKKIYSFPDQSGYFGAFGGTFVPPSLEPILQTLTMEFEKAMHDPLFQKELRTMYRDFANRPSPLYFAQRLTRKLGGAKIYLKREDLNHTGAHKINNAIGQGLLAKRMGKKKLIAETGAGQHGVATATIAAYLGMECDVYMGARDIDAQKPNVYRMKILGATVIPVTQGQGTLKDAVDVALTAYINESHDVHYLLGSVVGPHPYPYMVREFQKIIGQEAKAQIMAVEKDLPDYVVACVGGGSNAIGLFHDFISDESVQIVAVEPAGKGKSSGRHGLSLQTGQIDVIHGFKTLVMKNPDGSVKESYSAASGLDYPGVGPELSMLKASGRMQLAEATDEDAVRAFVTLSQTEGIIPALESAHAIAQVIQMAPSLSQDTVIVVNLSGRGDKDVEHVYETFLKK
ncbi:MAG: tryptophan synthase subunit beta [Candidatus Roizmanbacteria bacterium]